MNEIRLGAMTADFMPKALQDRCGAVQSAAGTWNAERHALGHRMETIREVRAQHYEDTRAIDGQGSWIQEHTFTDQAAALAELVELQRARVGLPVRGLALDAEVESVRDAVQSAWTAHKAGLEKALADAEASARKQAAKLPVSAALKEQHVAEVTQAERQAAAVRNPCPADWWGWKAESVKSARAVLLEELRCAFASALGC